jgi:hypothetical protein
VKKYSGKDIKAASIQRQILDLSKELSLIGQCINNSQKEEGLNLLILTMQSLSRIGTKASLDRLAVEYPSIAKILRYSNNTPVFTLAMKEDWDTLQKNIYNRLL